MRPLAIEIRALARRAPLPVRVRVEVDGPLPSEVEAVALAFCESALDNCAQHAHPGHVAVDAVVRDGLLVVRVADDGVGGAPGSLRLAGAAARVRALGGALEVTSPPGTGTLVEAALPLARG